MKTEPTKEQTQWLWEQCGFTYLPYKGDPFLGKIHDACWLTPNETEISPSNWSFKLPPIDPNNLFKYAVPLAIDKIMKQQECDSNLARQILFKHWLQKIEDGLPDEDALFWVIWEVIHND